MTEQQSDGEAKRWSVEAIEGQSDGETEQKSDGGAV